MGEVHKEVSGSFTVGWFIPSAAVSYIMKFTRNIFQSFYQEYNITSLTLDGMWIQLSDAEIDAMWSQLHVSDTNFEVQFHAMYKQIVYELEIAQIKGHQLSLFFHKSLKFHQSTNYSLSHELLNHKLPVSIVDFRVLAAAIEGFGSHCLKSVMSSYSKYMSNFLKKSTAQQLINLSAIRLIKSSGYSIVKCRIKEEPSRYKLDKLFEFRTEFCTIADLSELCFIMDEVNTEMSGSFIISWLVPPAFMSGITKPSRNIDHSLYHRFNITSLTLDGLWLFLSEAEIDAMWSRLHVSDTKFKNQFHTMCKQIVCEIFQVQCVSKDHLSLYFQSLNYQQQISDQFSLAVLEEEFPASFVDFGVLEAVIEGFGSDCLKRVMESYCNYMSIFTKESTAQQLINLSALQSKHWKHFVAAKCTIMEEPSCYSVEKLLQFRTRFCAIASFNEVYFVMDEVNMEVSGSFTVSWFVPSSLISDIMVKSAGYVDRSFYQEYKITSLTLDGMWLFLSEAEIDAMWLKMHVGDTELSDQFHIMHKQILCEVDGIGRSTATDKLSSYLMDQQPTLQRDVNVNICKAFLNPNFPISLIDFRMLTTVIELFGSDCLKRVMESYCHFMSIFIRQSTLEPLIDLPLIQSKVLEHFLDMDLPPMQSEDSEHSDVDLSPMQSEVPEHFFELAMELSPPEHFLDIDLLYQSKVPEHFLDIDLPPIQSRVPEDFLAAEYEPLKLTKLSPPIKSRDSENFFAAEYIHEPLKLPELSPPIKLRGPEHFLATEHESLKLPKRSPLVAVSECKIEGEPFKYGLEKLLEFRTKFCSMIKINKVCFVMGEVRKRISGSFIVSWHIPSAAVSYIVKFTRNISPSIHQEYKIASLTLDGMWIFLSDAKIDVMWHPSDFESQFLTMYRQIICELKVQEISRNELSSYLMDQNPKLQSNASIQLSKVFLKYGLPLHLRLQSTVIEKFGSDCLKNIMKSFYNYVYTGESTVEQLVSLPPIPSQISKYFVSVESRNREDPSDCRLARLLFFQARFCDILNIDEVCFILEKIETETGGSFIVKWYVPSGCLALELLKSANQLDLKQTEIFQEMNILSLKLGGMWLYNYQLTPLGSKLKEKYQQSQGLPPPVEWIPSPTRKIFRLAMIQRERVQRGHIEDRFVQMTISGRVDDILHAKSPVELEDIFRYTLHGGEIILIEGAPGSGKSTLIVHICQRWGKEELFQQFTVVILVQLRDPAVQRAQTIADLLPAENAEEITAELIATNGRGVLWVLDGWDELPSHLQQDSIFRKLIKRVLKECSVIVTSRPISSGDLHPVVSSRIEVLGFTPEEQRQYFTECLKRDTKALEALLEKIQENPVVQSICYLPLNAAFVVQTFKYKDQSLPNTEYEIYLSVILSCIQRHYDREGRGHDLPRELESLDDLSRSEAVREPFQCLCELAYRGVMENKVTFSSSDLPQGSNTLSLLQAIESFLKSGKSVFYNFLHLSVQEVLSAYYITTKLSDSEQVSQFQQLFNQPRFAAVFQFYAAITKLKSPGIRQVIDRIVEAKSKPLLVSLLRCLHEAQDPALCLYVGERLEYRPDLSETSLSPLDCLSVGFFLSSVAIMKISVNLKHCAISDFGANCLSKYLHADNSLECVSNMTIDLTDNEVNEEGALHITNMLYLFEHLYLPHNPIGDTGASLISEAVRETTTLKTLILYHCGITSRGAEDLSRALAQNSSLEKLDIGRNDLKDDGISHVAEALKQNTQLKELWIGQCGITDKGAASLASAITVNNSLKMLHMGGGDGALTEDGLLAIANSLANKSLFEKLLTPSVFGYSTDAGLDISMFGYSTGAGLDIPVSFRCTTNNRLCRMVNEARKRNGLPPIKVEGEWYYCMLYGFVCLIID